MIRFITALLSIIVASCPNTLFGRTLISGEQAALSQMATAMAIYADTHNGQQVTSWEQLREVFALDAANASLGQKLKFPLQDYYQFISQAVPLPRVENSQIILLRAVPFQFDGAGSKRRLLLIHDTTGRFGVLHLREEEIQEAFRSVNVPFPLAKPDLPAVTSVSTSLPDEPEASPRPLDNPAREPHRNRTQAPNAAPTSTSLTPEPSAPSAQPTVVPAERRVPAWPWVAGGILALIIIAALVLKRRA